jgi:hypothetical protein
LKAALSGREPLEKQLKERPLLAKVVVSRVELDELPAPLRVPGLRGAVRLEGTVRGSASAPVGSLAVRASDLRFAVGDRGEPVDVCGTAEYAQESGAFNLGAEVFLPGSFELSRAPCNGRRIASVQFRGQAPFDFERGVPAWSGTASANLESLPLNAVPQLAEARMTGMASGTLVLDRSGEQPRASAELQLADVKVDQLAIGNGTLKLRSDQKSARVDFAVQRGQTSLSGSLKSGLSWASQLPALDAAQPIDIAVRATKLEASALEPILSDFVSELRGNLDGDLSARLEPLAPGEDTRRIDQVSGTLALSDGALVLTGLGFRLREVEFTATAKRDGKTTLVDVPNLKANAGAKSRNLAAHLILRLAGFDIVSGSGSFEVNSLPLVVDGITRANADAKVNRLDIKRTDDLVKVDVPFEWLHIRLPNEEPRQLIELNENERITVLQPIAEPVGNRDENAIPWQFSIHLGGDASVKRGAQLDLPITGDPNVTLAAGLGVSGSIMLPRRGAVQILGRMFQIEGGAVVFDTPDPKDPRLDVRATWRSSAGDTLFMYVSGTLSKPKVQFDRPLADAIALLAGTSNTNEGGLGDANIGFTALDQLLADTPLARVQLRGKDSGETGKGAIYTAAYRASDRVVVEGNYQSAASTASNQTAGGVGAAVDYRMTKTVSVRAQLGTIGTGVDLVYQYRY